MVFSKKRWFAIRIGAYVEVRETKKPIKAITSTLTKTVGKKKRVWTQTWYEGGRVVLILPYVKYALRMGTIQPDCYAELSELMFTSLKRKRKRGY